MALEHAVLKPAAPISAWHGGAWHQTLKFRVVLVAVVSALLGSTLSVFFVMQGSEAEALRRVEWQQLEEVRLLAALMEARIEQTQGLLRQLARAVAGAQPLTPALAERLWSPQASATGVFDFVDLFTPDGQPLLHKGVAPVAAVQRALQPLREQTLRRLDGQILAVPDGAGPAPRVWVLLSWPVRDSQGLLRAVVMAGLPLSSPQWLPASARPSVQFEAPWVLLAADGLILAHPEPSRRLQRVQDDPELKEVFADWQAASSAEQASGLNHSGADRISSLARVESPGWLLARVTPASQVLAPYRAQRRQAWWLTVVITALCAGAAAGLMFWLTRPVGLLAQRMRQLLDRSLPVEAGWPKAGGDMGRLVEAVRQTAMAQDREQQSLRLMVGQLEAILTYASVGIVVTRHRTLELLGHQASAMLGYGPDELRGQPARVLYPSDEAYAELGQQVRMQFQSQGHFDGELLFRRKDGSDFWVHMLGRGVVPDDPDGGTIWIFDDITAEREAREALSWSATHDSLTGLVNRRELEARLASLLRSLEGQAMAQGCLLFVDLDRFKNINDSAGHAAGDWVLQQMARLMESHVRQSDTVARLGGDEFALLLPTCNRERALSIAQSLCSAIEAWRIEVAAQVFYIGASIGLVEIGPGFKDVAAVLHAADMACYAAKRAGRNQVMSLPAEPVSVF